MTKTSWLLALCGILDAMHAGLNLMMLNPGGSLGLRRGASVHTVWDMGLLALLAGVCAIAVGAWSGGRSHSWLLSLHGLALGAFGLIAVTPLVRGPLSFRPVSLLFIVMSLSVAAFAIREAGGRPLFRAAGAVSIGYAVSFLAVGFNRIRLAPPNSYWIWMASFFAFCAVFMVWLALRWDGARLPALPSLRHAH